MATEMVQYRVISTATDYEVREYGPRLVAETTVEGDFDSAASTGFRRLAGYIFGRNKGQKTIAMTSPVTQARAGNDAGFLVRFTMPAAQTSAAMPEPLDRQIRIVELPSRRVAAHRFSGFWSDRNFDRHVATLRTALVRDGVVTHGEPEVARYDPPWTLWFLRRNEILFDVAGENMQTPSVRTAVSTNT